MKRFNRKALFFAAVLGAQALSGCGLGGEDGPTLDPADLVFVEQSHPELKGGGEPESGGDFDAEGEVTDPQPEPQKPGNAAAAPSTDEEAADEEAEDRLLFQGDWREEEALDGEEVRSFPGSSSSADRDTGVLHLEG